MLWAITFRGHIPDRVNVWWLGPEGQIEDLHQTNVHRSRIVALRKLRSQNKPQRTLSFYFSLEKSIKKERLVVRCWGICLCERLFANKLIRSQMTASEAYSFPSPEIQIKEKMKNGNKLSFFFSRKQFVVFHFLLFLNPGKGKLLLAINS